MTSPADPFLGRPPAGGPGAPELHFPDEAFPPYRFVPGKNPHPFAHEGGWGYGTDRAPPPFVERDAWSGNTAYLRGVDLFNRGWWWEAHEVWETLWKESRSDYYQGLIQMAAALIKVHIGQWSGAGRLIARARERLAQTAGADLLEQFDRCFGDGPEQVVWENAPRIRN